MISNITDKPRKLRQIFTTAEQLFQRYGFRRVTIEEICQQASVSKMTFYKYFTNKGELIRYMLDIWLSESKRMMDEVNAMDIPFTEKIRRILRLKEESSMAISHEFMADYMNPDEELKIYIQEFYSKVVALFIDFIKVAQAKGEVRPEIRPEFLIALLNKLVELAKDEQLVKLYPSITEFSLEINNFFYCGILPLDKVEK